jgi:hypothetical protein
MLVGQVDLQFRNPSSQPIACRSTNGSRAGVRGCVCQTRSGMSSPTHNRPLECRLSKLVSHGLRFYPFQHVSHPRAFWSEHILMCSRIVLRNEVILRPRTVISLVPAPRISLSRPQILYPLLKSTTNLAVLLCLSI